QQRCAYLLANGQPGAGAGDHEPQKLAPDVRAAIRSDAAKVAAAGRAQTRGAPAQQDSGALGTVRARWRARRASSPRRVCCRVSRNERAATSWLMHRGSGSNNEKHDNEAGLRAAMPCLVAGDGRDGRVAAGRFPSRRWRKRAT
ncbi:hypothetical protein ACFFYR_32765, partial [Paraburkholderia dipogonis]